MSGNVDDRWIWRGARPVSTTSSPIALHVGQSVTPQTQLHFTSESKVNLFISTLVNKKSQIVSHTTTEVSDISQSTTHSLLKFTPTDKDALPAWTNTTHDILPPWTWYDGAANTNHTTGSNKFTSSIQFLLTENTGISNFSRSCDALVNKCQHSTLDFHNVETITWSLPSNELPIISSLPNIVSDDILHGGPTNGIQLASGTQYSHILSYLVIFFLVLLLAISILANSTIFLTIICRRYMRRSYFILYSSLAVSDMMASVFIIPVAVFGIIKSQEAAVFPPCSLVVATMVLTTYVSVGTLCSICIIRWWQFYNFSQTRTQEKLAVRFFILLFWTTGSGIYFGFMFKNIGKMGPMCTLDNIVEVLQDTLPLTSISVSVGFMVTTTVNYLTIQKTRKSIYPHNYQGSGYHCLRYMHKFLNSRVKTHYIKEQESSDVDTLDGYNIQNTNNTFDIENKPSQNSDKASALTCVTFRNVSNLTGCENLSSNHSTTEPSSMPENTVRSFEATEQPRRSASLGPPDNCQPDTTHYSTDNKNPEHSTASSTSSLASDNLELKDRMFLGPANNALQLTGGEVELASETLHGITEPTDVQQVIPQHNTSNFSKRLQTPTPPIPNTVENVHYSDSVIMRQTTIHNRSFGPPKNHIINTLAWKNKDVFEPLPAPAVKDEAVTANKKTFHTQDNHDVISQAIMKASTHNKTAEKTTIKDSLISFINENSERSLTCPIPESLLPSMKSEDVTYTGYLADLSATSSRHSTPHHKLHLKRRTERSSVLPTGRTVSQDSGDSDNWNTNPFSPVIAAEVGGCHQQSCPQPHAPSTTNSDKQVRHPVRLKCVRTSQCLVVFFAAAYLPLLVLQALVSTVQNSTVFFVFIFYISFLLAIHPSLYGFQSSILKNAIKKQGKKLTGWLHSSEN